MDYGIGFHYLNFEDRYLRFPEYFLKITPEVQERKNITQDYLNRDFCNFIYSNSKNGEGAIERIDFCKKLIAPPYKHAVRVEV